MFGKWEELNVNFDNFNVLSHMIIFRDTRDIGVQCTLGSDPLPDIDEEPPCKRQRQLGKIFNWHVIL